MKGKSTRSSPAPSGESTHRLRRPTRGTAVKAVVALLAFALAGALAVGAVGAAPSPDANGTITNCTVVDEPGQYELAGDVQSDRNGTCIEIRADGVVLDGEGAAIEGPGASANGSEGSSAAGVHVNGSASESYENVTVEDVAISGFDDGVRAGTGGSGDDTSVALVDVQINDTDRGVVLRGGNTTLSNVTVEDSEYGIYALGSGRLKAFDVALRNNSDGLDAAETGLLYLETSVVEHNDGNGVDVGPSVRLKTNELDVVGNGEFGVAAADQDASVMLTHGAVRDNGDAGVMVRGPADARLSEMNVSGNGADGVRTVAGGEVTLYGVTARGNDGWELDARKGNATARDLRLGPTTTASFNSGPVALEPVDRVDLPAPPENRTVVGDGVNITGSEMAVGITFEVDTDVDPVEVWRHDGTDWLLEGETALENGTITKYTSGDGVLAPFGENSDDPGSDEQTQTPTETDGATATETSRDGSTATEDSAGGADDSNAGADDVVEDRSSFAIGDGSGFVAAVAILALLGSAFLAYRRR